MPSGLAGVRRVAIALVFELVVCVGAVTEGSRGAEEMHDVPLYYADPAVVSVLVLLRDMRHAHASGQRHAPTVAYTLLVHRSEIHNPRSPLDRLCEMGSHVYNDQSYCEARAREQVALDIHRELAAHGYLDDPYATPPLRHSTVIGFADRDSGATAYAQEAMFLQLRHGQDPHTVAAGLCLVKSPMGTLSCPRIRGIHMEVVRAVETAYPVHDRPMQQRLLFIVESGVGRSYHAMSHGEDVGALAREICTATNCAGGDTTGIYQSVQRSLEGMQPPQLVARVAVRPGDPMSVIQLRHGEDSAVLRELVDNFCVNNGCPASPSNAVERMVEWLLQRLGQTRLPPLRPAGASDLPLTTERWVAPIGAMVLDLGGRKEHFLDRFLVHTEHGDVQLRVARPVLAGERSLDLPPDHVHRGRGMGYFSVHREALHGGLRLSYREACSSDSHHSLSTGTATGRGADGEYGFVLDRPARASFHTNVTHAQRPFALLHFACGSGYENKHKSRFIEEMLQRHDNIGHASHNFFPFLDTNPDCLPEERYKAIGGSDHIQHSMLNVDGSDDDGVYAFASSDGVAWWLMQDGPILTLYDIEYNVLHNTNYDALNTVFWDQTCRCYRLFSRSNPAAGERSIQWSESDDFLRWSPPRPVKMETFGDPGFEQFYIAPVQPVPDAPHILIAYPMRCTTQEMRCDIVAMTSRDGGRSFNRLGGNQPWIVATDSTKKSFPTNNSTMAAPTIGWFSYDACPVHGIITSNSNNGDWFMFSHQHIFSPDSHLTRHVLPGGRLGSIVSGSEGGQVVTRLVFVSGSRLVLNYGTTACGPSVESELSPPSSIVVELLEHDGTAVDGFSMSEHVPLVARSSLKELVCWEVSKDVEEGDAGARYQFEVGSSQGPGGGTAGEGPKCRSMMALKGTALRLRFILRCAELYSMKFV